MQRHVAAILLFQYTINQLTVGCLGQFIGRNWNSGGPLVAGMMGGPVGVYPGIGMYAGPYDIERTVGYRYPIGYHRQPIHENRPWPGSGMVAGFGYDTGFQSPVSHRLEPGSVFGYLGESRFPSAFSSPLAKNSVSPALPEGATVNSNENTNTNTNINISNDMGKHRKRPFGRGLFGYL